MNRIGEAIRPINNHLHIQFEREWLDSFQNRLQQDQWDDWTCYRLAMEAAEARTIHSFDDLLCLRQQLNIQPLPHQLDTARKVLTEMRGRAILADEVGLGKTIEAGLILKEYLLRGLVKKALILVPASLVLQWVRELNEKLGIQAIAQKKAYMWEQFDIVVASLDTAKREPNKTIVTAQEYDLLIIDEAHKLKNNKTSNYQFVQSLRKKYCLMLTATPVQNDLAELYNLITILKPGQLGDLQLFQQRFVANKRIPKNEWILQQELSKIMIRNTRSDGGVAFTKRHVTNIPLTLSPEEQRLYDGVTSFVKDRYYEAENNISSILALVTLQREVCSSRDAVFLTLVNLFKKTTEDSPIRAKIWDLIELIRGIQTNTKAAKTVELVQKIQEKVIIFTEYRASQEYLMKYLSEHGISSVPYRGGMNRGKKDWMKDLFHNKIQVLVATEAGGEGINLQFCHHIINFDLPWNPMRIEQRIGRVHRLGQKHDVHIYNLSTIGTIEEHILHLLMEKINMFELVIGELDTIVERLDGDVPFEARILQLMVEANHATELQNRMKEVFVHE